MKMKNKKGIIFILILLIIVSSNAFSNDVKQFNYAENISFDFIINDSSYSLNVTQIILNISNSTQTLFYQNNNTENLHNKKIDVFLENIYNQTSEIYNLTPGSYNLTIKAFDKYENKLTQEYEIKINKPNEAENNFNIDLLNNIEFNSEFSFNISSAKIPIKINNILLIPNLTEQNENFYCKIKNITNPETSTSSSYSKQYNYTFKYNGTDSIHCNYPASKEDKLNLFKNNNLRLIINYSTFFSNHEIKNSTYYKSDFEVNFESEAINFDKDSWNVVGKNNQLIFNAKNKDQLEGRLNITLSDYPEESIELNDNEELSFDIGKSIELTGYSYNFSDEYFYYNYNGDFPGSNEMLLTQTLFNSSDIYDINGIYFKTKYPLKLKEYDVVNKSGEGYFTYNYLKKRNQEIKVIPKMDNGFFDAEVEYLYEIIYDNTTPKINFTNINFENTILLYDLEYPTFSIQIDENNLPSCKEKDYFFMQITNNKSEDIDFLTCDDISEIQLDSTKNSLNFSYNFLSDRKYNFSIVVFDKGYNKIIKNYTNVVIDKKDFDVEINNINEFDEISEGFTLNNNYYLNQNKTNVKIKFQLIDSYRSLNITIKDDELLIEKIKCKLSDRSIYGETYECNSTIELSEKNYSIEYQIYAREYIKEDLFINVSLERDFFGSLLIDEGYSSQEEFAEITESEIIDLFIAEEEIGDYTYVSNTSEMLNLSNKTDEYEIQLAENGNLINPNSLIIDKTPPVITIDNLFETPNQINKEFYFKFNVSDNIGYKTDDINYYLKNEDNCEIKGNLKTSDGYFKLLIECFGGKIGDNDILINVNDYVGNQKHSEFDFEVEEMGIIVDLIPQEEDIYNDGNKYYLQEYGEFNYTLSFKHSHNLNLTKVSCTRIYDNAPIDYENNSKTNNSKISQSLNVQKDASIRYQCSVNDETEEEYRFLLNYEIDVFGVYAVNYKQIFLKLNNNFEFDLFTKDEIDLETSKFNLYYLNRDVKSVDCDKINNNEYNCSFILTLNDLGEYKDILNGFSSEILPKFNLKLNLTYSNSNFADIAISKPINWNFSIDEKIEDNDIVINFTDVTNINHTYCDENLVCNYELLEELDMENNLFIILKENRNQIDIFDYMNNSKGQTLSYIKNNTLNKDPIDLTSNKECYYKELYSNLNDDTNSNTLIYKTNCEVQIDFETNEYENRLYSNEYEEDKVYYLALKNNTNKAVLTIMIGDIIETKVIEPNIINKDTLFISNINSKITKKIESSNLFYFDENINSIYENSSGRMKEFELNSSYNYVEIDSDNIFNNNQPLASFSKNDIFNLEIGIEKEGLYKCYLSFNNRIVDVQTGYNFYKNLKFNIKKVLFNYPLINETGNVEVKVICDLLNSNIRKEIWSKEIHVSSDYLDLKSLELQNQNTIINISSNINNYKINDFSKTSDFDFLNKGYNKYNFSILDSTQLFSNNEIIYEDLDEIIVYNDGNNGLLIYNPYAAKEAKYSFNTYTINSSNKYIYLVSDDNSIKNDQTKNNLIIEYEFNNRTIINSINFVKRDDRIFSNSDDIIYYNEEIKTYFIRFNYSNQYNFNLPNTDFDREDYFSNCQIYNNKEDYEINISKNSCFVKFITENSFNIVFINDSLIKNKVNLVIDENTDVITTLNISDRIRFDKGNLYSNFSNSQNIYFVDIYRLSRNNYDLFYTPYQDYELNTQKDSYDHIGNQYINRSIENVNLYGTYELTNFKYNKLSVKYSDIYILEIENVFELISGKNNLLFVKDENYSIKKQGYNNSGFKETNLSESQINSINNIIEIQNISDEIQIDFGDSDPILDDDELIFTKQFTDIKFNLSDYQNIDDVLITGIDENYDIIFDYTNEEIIIEFNDDLVMINNDSEIFYGEDIDSLSINESPVELNNNYEIKLENNYFEIENSENIIEVVKIYEAFRDSFIEIKNVSTTNKNIEITVNTINGEDIVQEIVLNNPQENMDSSFVEYVINNKKESVLGLFNQYGNIDKANLINDLFTFYTDYPLRCNGDFESQMITFDDYELLNYHIFNFSNEDSYYKEISGLLEVVCYDENDNLLLNFNKEILPNIDIQETSIITITSFFSKSSIESHFSQLTGEIYYDTSNNCQLKRENGEFLLRNNIFSSNSELISLLNCEGENIKLYEKNEIGIFIYDYTVFPKKTNTRPYQIRGKNSTIPKVGENNYIYTEDNLECYINEKNNENKCQGEQKIHFCNISQKEFDLICYDINNELKINATSQNLDKFNISFKEDSKINNNIYEVNFSCNYLQQDLPGFVKYNNDIHYTGDIFVFNDSDYIEYYCQYDNKNILVNNLTKQVQSDYIFLNISDEILENSYYKNGINYIFSDEINIKTQKDFFEGYDSFLYYNNKNNYYIDLATDNYRIITTNENEKIIISKPHYNYNIVEDKLYSQVIN